MGSQNESVNPFSELAMGATAIHELFLAYRSAGFTTYQAILLIGVTIAHQSQLN